MHDWLAARASASPETIALVQKNKPDFQVLNYQQLNHLVTWQAAQLFEMGIRPENHIAVQPQGSLEDVILLHALIKNDAVIVPLNSRLTGAEITYQVSQSQAWLLTKNISLQAQIANSFFLGEVLSAESEFYDDFFSGHQNLHAPDVPLAIIHTSGTSGKPKGAVLTYGNFFYSAMASAYRIGHLPDDKWLCVLPLYHVGGLSILLRAVLNGTTVDLRSKFDVDEANHVLSHEDVTLVSLVPTMLYRLLEKGTPEKWKKLRLILLGGAAASIELLEECRKRNLPVATTYGLTEACSQVATALPHEVYAKMGTVGKPLMFTQIKIVDEEGKPQKAGNYGEILVKGPTVMQGYYNDPEATAKVLRDGWLHTGDIGYLDKDGDLFLVQRRSDLIVSGGENVYPAEIEHVLRQHPAVQEAVVVGLDDAEWGQKVAAAIQLREGQSMTEAEMMAFARTALAGYKIPRIIKFVSEFPMTGSGKIQRGAVRENFESAK